MNSVHALNVTKMAHDDIPYILLVGAHSLQILVGISNGPMPDWTVDMINRCKSLWLTNSKVMHSFRHVCETTLRGSMTN